MAMISVEEAHNIIQSMSIEWGTEEMPLHKSVGRVLAVDIFADRDFPPFDRVTMDGVAVSYAQYEVGKRVFEIQDTQYAGEPAKTLQEDFGGLEIMTGAMLSHGCDMVIRYEDIAFDIRNGKRFATILDENGFRWKNIHKQSSDSLQGSKLLEKGTLINSSIISILASVGTSKVKVKKLPKVAIVSTGDELVDLTDKPLLHQIRKSNVITMQASLTQKSIKSKLFHLSDDKSLIKESILNILTGFDVVLLSGGVSKGKADFLPEVLDEIGVDKKFHCVSQRPGKPFWYGVYKNSIPVFAFPGNPISTIMCFRVYFLEWLVRQMNTSPLVQKAILSRDIDFRPDLGYFLQVRTITNEAGQLIADPVAGNGSGDIANLAASDAFVYLPQGQETYRAGTAYDWYPFI